VSRALSGAVLNVKGINYLFSAHIMLFHVLIYEFIRTFGVRKSHNPVVAFYPTPCWIISPGKSMFYIHTQPLSSSLSLSLSYLCIFCSLSLILASHFEFYVCTHMQYRTTAHTQLEYECLEFPQIALSCRMNMNRKRRQKGLKVKGWLVRTIETIWNNFTNKCFPS
jgi:hypothetical protein